MHIKELTHAMIYQVIQPLKGCMGEQLTVGERLTFADLGWSHHDGWFLLNFEERRIALDLDADHEPVHHIEKYLRPLQLARELTPLTLADLQPGASYLVITTFIDSNRVFFKAGERLTYAEQSFDEAADQHAVRFEQKTLTLWRGHDVSLHGERFFRKVD